MFLSIWTLFSRYRSHFLTHVFSSPPFFPLPRSLEFAAGQKAAAEAQPIWSAAPPSWRSERQKGTRLDVKPGAKSTSCLHAQENCGARIDLFARNWRRMMSLSCLRGNSPTRTADSGTHLKVALGFNNESCMTHV